MSRKKSGFAITSVRGGSGAAPGDASGAATGSSSSSSSASSSGSPSGSRFRLVRLLSPGEVLRRGRWLCRDFYERVASPRGGGGGGGGRLPVSLDAPRAVAAPHQPRSLGAFAQLVQQVRGGACRGGAALATPPSPLNSLCLQALPPKPPSPRPDLVKSHLLLAVREEVEALREQIRELSERRAALERENCLLRALATPQQLARLRSPQPPGPHPGPP
ncbi:T22D3 protein, partial [Vireo altiloquus]|nr:T22D3 protein [Vireo altiloquus]